MTLNWPDIVDDNLQAAVAAKLVDIELVSQLHCHWYGWNQ
ncbi:hypothetical protein EC970007_3367 [Escherichia coli 97.0007]|nr:hypothetical protein EC970007_3367 [Escherichia coli 97.0007]